MTIVTGLISIAIIIGCTAFIIGPALKRAIVINLAWARFSRARKRCHAQHRQRERVSHA